MIDAYSVIIKHKTKTLEPVYYKGYGSPEKIVAEIERLHKAENLVFIQMRQQLDKSYRMEENPSFVKRYQQAQMDLFEEIS